LDARVLVDDRVHRPIKQQCLVTVGSIVTDKGHLTCLAMIPQGARDALIAGADVIDAGQIFVAVEQDGRLSICPLPTSAVTDLSLRVLDGGDAIRSVERKISAIAQQPRHEFPEPSGRFLPLGGCR